MAKKRGPMKNLSEEDRKRRSDQMKAWNAERWSDPDERKKAGKWMAEGRKRKWDNDEEWSKERTAFLTELSRRAETIEVIKRYNDWRRLNKDGTEYDDE